MHARVCVRDATGKCQQHWQYVAHDMQQFRVFHHTKKKSTMANITSIAGRHIHVHAHTAVSNMRTAPLTEFPATEVPSGGNPRVFGIFFVAASLSLKIYFLYCYLVLLMCHNDEITGVFFLNVGKGDG